MTQTLLLFVLPSCVALIQLVLELQRRRRRERTALLARKNPKVPTGYFRIGPYGSSEEDQRAFKRVDGVHERILRWILTPTQTVFYLTGDSGSGKSSTLNAFVIPQLLREGWNAIQIRAWQDPVASLASAIEERVQNSARAPSWQDVARHLVEISSLEVVGLLVSIDQFEEYLILSKPDQQAAFNKLLDELRASASSKLRILFTLRSDYIPMLDELKLPPLRQGENWQQIGRFSHANSFEFMRSARLGLSSEALETLIQSASELDDTPGLIRPITLNAVGFILADGMSQAISLDVGVLVRRYIQQTTTSPGIREFAPAVLEQLITEQGTKKTESEKRLADRSKLSLGEVRAVLNSFADAGLARPLDDKRIMWELSHDFIARAVTRYLGRRTSSLVRPLVNYAATILAVGTISGSAVYFALQPASLPPLSKPLSVFSGVQNPPLDELSHSQHGQLVGDATISPDPADAEAPAVFRFLKGGYFSADEEHLPSKDHDRTIAIWVYAMSFLPPPNEAFFVGYGHFRNSDEAVTLGAGPSHKISFSTWNVNGLEAKDPMVTHKWYFVALTMQKVIDANTLVTLYVNGEAQNHEEILVNTVLASTGPEIDRKLVAGALPDDGTDRTMRRILIGYAKDLMIYDRALQADEIRWLYQHPGNF